MTKRKPTKQTKPEPKTYTVDTEHGTLRAMKHQFNGTVYVQRELLSPQLDAIA